MSAKNDKRKANRIQGGWGKSGKNKSSLESNIPQEDLVYFDRDAAPQFDNNVVGNLELKCKFIEISNDVNLDLNTNLNNELEDKIPATVKLINGFIPENEAQNLCAYFIKNLPWVQRENATPSGETFLEPRQTCWYGLPYTYSKISMAPNNNWDPKLKELLTKVQCYTTDTDKPFNSVMCNLYVGAKNSIDWHADDEKGLGKCPTIASISLGCTRAFELCKRGDLFNDDYNKKSKNIYRSRTKEDPPFDDCTILYRVFLKSGSLLLMSGSVQDYWLHRVPKEYHDQTPRINFTFRHIISEDV